MWQIEQGVQFEKDRKWYSKKRPQELAAVLHNLDRYVQQLNAAPNSKAVHAGYMHHEPHGVVAIDQRGGGANLQETRMYTYADDENKVLYLATIGNKDEQNSDIEFSKLFADGIRQRGNEKNKPF
jgi:hypothetical protein